MKRLSYILSCYMLLLSVFPCCAIDNCPDERINTEQAANHTSGDEDDCGSCSPFFNCEGCAPVNATVETVYFTIIPFPVKQEYTGFISPLIPDNHYDIWQPPKLD